ncbi:kelch-like protein 10 [Synchiropus splendidus]|uniref:kelch-like protein 10 n=1 Tax=Synchiropus splendidus TaxID=270530 RepID=UPI00237D4A7B|nr:kelch-like protein 10 [Synchiropus splendidus]
MSSVLNELRLEGDFCDAVIQVDTAEFPIHKNIMCNCSSYFRVLFNRWSSRERRMFNISGLSSETMQLIIEFAYTGTVCVTEDNVRDLLRAADYFNVINIANICCTFLGERLSLLNCISVWQLSNTIYSFELQQKAYWYILDHFEEVVLTEGFSQLTVEELSNILERDDLNVKEESTVFEAVIHWISREPETRSRHIALLLSKVRLALLSIDYMKMKVCQNNLVKNSSDSLSIVDHATNIILYIITNRLNVPGFYNLVARPRLPNCVLLATGGWVTRDATKAIEAYDIRVDRWRTLSGSLELACGYHGAVFLNGFLYCLGGFNGEEYFNRVHRCDLRTQLWDEISPMHCRRCYVSVTVLNGHIYALGGYNGNQRLRSAEYYRTERNQWNLIAPMHEPRSDASCSTFRNMIYICGGFNGVNCLQTAECYNPETNQWTMISNMTSLRSGLGVFAYANSLYAVGGYNGQNRLRTAEAYNPQTDSWHAISPMLTPRSNFGIEVLEDRLFVVGGFNGTSVSSDVEYYDATTDVWSAACNIDIDRSALNCCVVYGLSNMSEFVVPRYSLPALGERMDLEDLD